MSTKKILTIVVVLIVLAIPFINYQLSHKSASQFTTFEDLTGPKDKSSLAPMKPTDVSEFSQGSSSRLAILLTDKNSSWTDLIKGFKSIGVPFIVTADYKEALKHKVIFIYPYISGLVLPGQALKELFNHPKNGGTLIAVNVLGGGMEEVFGFQKIVEGDSHKEIRFNKSFSDMITAPGKAVDDNEKFIRLVSKKEKSEIVTNSYQKTKMPPLAVFDNGEAAITQNDVGPGHAYALGIDLGQLFYIGYSNREEDIARTYVNHYEPAIDLFLRFIKNIFLKNEPNAVVLGTVPEAKEISMMWSHDVDYAYSVKNSLLYSDLEKENGIHATYFLQVKYLKDFNDKIFFDQPNIEEINQVKRKGMEIASHSISHSRQFAKFPEGDGAEKYPTYKPFVVDRNNTKDGTVFGELRVSKFLIETKTAQKNVISFRPGDLSNPYSLPQTLLATGYRYSSSVTSNNSLTHLPFQLSYNREVSQLLPIYEFPVTIEDEEYHNMIEQIPVAIKLSEAIAQYGGIFVVLIHPNVPGHKLEFEKQVIKYWKERAWFGTIEEFGNWWATRNGIEVDSENNLITLTTSSSIKGLNLEIPKNKTIEKTLPEISIIRKDDKILLGEFKGELKIYLK